MQCTRIWLEHTAFNHISTTIWEIVQLLFVAGTFSVSKQLTKSAIELV